VRRDPLTVKKRAAVTGASAGIGKAFCERLAHDGWDLLVVARRKERLEALAARLHAAHGTEVEIVVADLSRGEGTAAVETVLEADERLELLVNNAGFANYGDFHELDRSSEADSVDVACRAVVRLTHAALGGMVRRGRGSVINVSSLAGLQPHPQAATYSAAKAFLVSFTQALHQDYADKGLRFQALCPGATRTEIFDVAGIDASDIPESTWMDPDAVVERSLADLEKGELVCIPGPVGRGEWIRSVVPAPWLRKAARILRRLART